MGGNESKPKIRNDVINSLEKDERASCSKTQVSTASIRSVMGNMENCTFSTNQRVEGQKFTCSASFSTEVVNDVVIDVIQKLNDSSDTRIGDETSPEVTNMVRNVQEINRESDCNADAKQQALADFSFGNCKKSTIELEQTIVSEQVECLVDAVDEVVNKTLSRTDQTTEKCGTICSAGKAISGIMGAMMMPLLIGGVAIVVIIVLLMVAKKGLVKDAKSMQSGQFFNPPPPPPRQ